MSRCQVLCLSAKGLSKDLSPVSIKNFRNYHHPCGLMAVHMKYPIKRFSTLARIGGAGYRTLAKIDHSRSAHFERVFAMWNKRSLPLYWWLGLGIGRPLNPYLSKRNHG